MAEPSSGELVRRAAQQDAAAWGQLVERHTGLIWSIARQYRLREADAADVVQTTWLRLLEHLDRLHDQERVAAWLATTARRECLRLVTTSRRLVPTDSEAAVFDDLAAADTSLDRLIALEDAREVRLALRELPDRWRALMELLMAEPAPSYQAVAALLDVPVGSIGPTRGRCLRKLRDLIEA